MKKYHSESLGLSALISHHESHISNTKESLRAKMMQTQEIRCVISIKSGYYLKMTSTSVLNDTGSPMTQLKNIEKAPKIQETSTLSNYKFDIERFLQILLQNISVLPQLFAKLSSNQIATQFKFLPGDLDAKSFLGCSSLPSIFGRCWCNELKISYINFLEKINMHLSQTIFANFRSHWLFDVYRSYIQSSSVNYFLRLSLGDVLLNLIRDPTIGELATSSNDHFIKMISYASKIIENMQSNLSVFPSDVKMLISSFANSAESESEKIQRAEILFIDCILTPAITLPKVYSVLPSSFYYSMSSTGITPTLMLLAQVFRLILHPSQAELRYPNFDIKKLQSLDFEKLLKELIKPVKIKSGPSIEELMRFTNDSSITLLFSFPDICLLSHIIELTADPHKHQLLYNSAKHIPKDENVGFEFFTYDCYELHSYSIPNPVSNGLRIELGPDTPLNNAVSALIKFLMKLKYDNNEPDGLAEFIEYHSENSKLHDDVNINAMIGFLISKLDLIPETDIENFPTAISDELKRYNSYSEALGNRIAECEMIRQSLESEYQAYKNKSIELLPAIHSALLEAFLQANPEIESELKEKRIQIIKERKLFHEFFDRTVKKIEDFIGMGKAEYKSGVIRNFHSWVMHHISLGSFIDSNPDFVRIDRQLSNFTDKQIYWTCIQPSPPKLQRLLGSPPLFLFAQNELQTAVKMEVPMEAVSHIEKAVSLIVIMFKLGIGGNPQADEMTPLLNFALLTSGIDHVFSFSKYIEHFVLEIPQREKFITDSEYISITHFVNHGTSLNQVIDSLE